MRYYLNHLKSKPLAKIFIDKYFKEIMPEIRKTDKYTFVFMKIIKFS